MSEPESPAAPPAAAAPPDDPQVAGLRAAVEHFMAGNFAAARGAVAALPRAELRPEIAKQADELLRRMGLDPVALWVALGSTLLFIVIVILTFRR